MVFGDADPSGRLPTTFPDRLEHNPSYGNFPGEAGQVRYGEGVLVGYRWYDARALPTSFPFGHGLSYTTFSLGEPRLPITGVGAGELEAGDTVAVSVDVTNTGTRRGAEVVQCYVAPRDPAVTRPPKELKAFAKVWLDPGATTTVSLELGARAFAYWQPTADRPVDDPASAAIPMFVTPEGQPAGWRVDPGTYDILIGSSSADLPRRAEVTIVGS